MRRHLPTVFVPLLALSVVVVAAAVWGLNRTASLATDIDRRSASIASAGGSINTSTKAIIRLDKTNELGDSIEETAKPLESKLAEVVRIAQSIDNLASSINGTARAINGTASGINSTATGILATGRSINNGVAEINRFVDVTTDLVRKVKADTANIIGQARLAHKEGSCIDKGLTFGGVNSSAPDDGHCNA